MLAASDLWQFSLATYARADVANHCLYLQDRWGANVNIMLWLEWLERQGLQSNAQTIVHAEIRIGAWHRSLIEPMRQLRRELAAQLTVEKEVEKELMDATYQQLKNAELHVEQVEQTLLVGLQVGLSASALPRGINLALYLDGLEVPELDQQRLRELF